MCPSEWFSGISKNAQISKALILLRQNACRWISSRGPSRARLCSCYGTKILFPKELRCYQTSFQVFHYVLNLTEGEVDVVGYLQIPTFFLLSGFCLSLGWYTIQNHPCSQDMVRKLNPGDCPSSTLPECLASIQSTSQQTSLGLLAGSLRLLLY